MIFGINTTRDTSKLSQIITILKYHAWYLCQISLQIMLLPILTPPTASKPSSLDLLTYVGDQRVFIPNLVWETYHLLPCNPANSQPPRPAPLPISGPCKRAQEMLDGFPKGSNERLESYRGLLYTTFISLKVRQYQQQVEMILAFPININSHQKHNLRPGMGF